MTAEELGKAVSKKRGPAKSERRKMAEEAGLSRAEVWRALQIAAIPDDEFERLIEADPPPTIAELVAIGSGKSPLAPARRLRRCPHCGGDLMNIEDTTQEPT